MLQQPGSILPAPLRAALRGDVIEPGDARYDGARALYFTGFDRRPAAIVRPADATDVARGVALARDAGVPLAVRCGGHSPAGFGSCDAGIVLDISTLAGLAIDVAGRTAWAGAGMTAGAYTAAVGAHGLATGFGDAPSVGIGGITLAGGVGFLHRHVGLTIDNVLAAEMVTADGRIVHTDADTEPDLFWAIRGGGGNFGVVTRLQYRLHAIDTVVGGMLLLPATPATVAAFFDAALAAPDTVSGMVNITLAPPLPFLPAAAHGKPIIMAVLVHAGADTDVAERAFAPLRAVATPIADTLAPLRYPQMFEGHEGMPHPVHMAVRPVFVDTLDRADGDRIIDALHAATAPMCVAQLRVLGGAVARVAPDATAFGHRDRAALLNVAAMYAAADEVERHHAWADDLSTALRRGGRGAYVGFLDARGGAHARDAYPAGTWQRLTAIKTRCDPDNVFRLNANVPPAPHAAAP